MDVIVLLYRCLTLIYFLTHTSVFLRLLKHFIDECNVIVFQVLPGFFYVLWL